MDEVVLIFIYIYSTGGWRSKYSCFVEDKRFVLHKMENTV